ncbi:hypothetical protein [Halanaerobacter jeridensis]|uniref:DNA-binding ribbon-helix-helix protein n=1 Tax=Halanaerobacter jeridensis TaxID=706427 RepID=A0A938XUT2_9FIRM|nr:hypothetical protein [Halanaerobacter jeridensis]MBM7556721.1 putative DNA-binding ribbon-helix-helix protein [Halanaerobacter jeridensis]
MKSQHLISVTPTTYELLEQIAQNKGQTINEVIGQLLNQHHEMVDLATGLDTVPSILVNQLDIPSGS